MRAYIVLVLFAIFASWNLANAALIKTVAENEKGGSLNVDQAAAAAALLEVDAGPDHDSEAPREARQYVGGVYYGRPYGVYYGTPYGGYNGRPYSPYGYNYNGNYGTYGVYPGFGFYG